MMSLSSMKTLLGIALISIIVGIFYRYIDFISVYLLDLLEFMLYGLAGFILLIITIYIKDRIAYHKLKRDMWKKPHADFD